jgi:protoporphyrinogen oxidase
MKIGIIGSGLCGLSSAYYLSKRKGIEVTVFEKNGQLGGLAGSFKFRDFFLEKYYHHIFKCDEEIIDLIQEIGIEKKLIWKETKMGFFHEKKIYPFGTPLELLQFKPLSFLERLKFGFTILYLQNLNSWRNLDERTAEEWLKKFSGKKTYEVIWKPLLRIKFGNSYEKISAAWIWGRIKPRAKSRSGSLMKEELGYIKGGFQVLIDKLEEEITKQNGKLMRETEVEKIEKCKEEKVKLYCSGNNNGKKEFEFDGVISTIPNPLFLRLLPKSSEVDAYSKNLKKVKYQSVVCATLLLKKPLSEIYWLNVSDPKIPFGGVIEHTNFISREEYGNFSVVYLFNYMKKGEKIYNFSDEQLIEMYKKGLKKIFPDFDPETLIVDYVINRDDYGTPVYIKNYSKLKPSFKTPLKNVFLANTSQIYPFDRNMNNSVKLGKKIAEKIFFE